MDDIKVRDIKWGGVLRENIPEDARASYGARLIHTELAAGGTGLVYDRQEGTGEAIEELIGILNGKRGLLAWAAVKRFGQEVRGSETVQYTYEDGDFKVQVTPNGSYGYIYLVAWLEKEAR
jgi:hypothetical protein